MDLKVAGKLHVSFTSLGTALETRHLDNRALDLSSGFSIHSCAFSALLFSHQDYISKMDPASTLGLSTESIHGYSLSHVKRVLDAEPPEMPPCRRGVNNISVALKG